VIRRILVSFARLLAVAVIAIQAYSIGESNLVWPNNAWLVFVIMFIGLVMLMGEWPEPDGK